MRILSISKEKDLKRVMQEIGVDTYGIKIMLPKTQAYLAKVVSLNNVSANILKQEMLSLGGDVAVSRDSLTGRVKKTDCLIIGNLSQFKKLSNKLQMQPFGLNKITQDLKVALKNFQEDNLELVLGKYRLNFDARSYIMGIVNVTPDSFSGDGLSLRSIDEITDFAQKLVEDGADILDIGGESTRPGAKPISIKEELARVIPVIKSVSRKINIPLSIDTYKPEVAKQALDNGADMVNDITALKDSSMAKVISRYKAGVVIMHMQGLPRSMQVNPKYLSLIDEIIEYLTKAMDRGINNGIPKEKIVIDPGIGFGKTTEHNLEVIKRLKEFKVLGRPILIGTSRKSFIGGILNIDPKERVFGTISSCVIAAGNGANIFRVHDVKALKQALLVRDIINK
ncbi:MAG: dihydropteroate synthase [Candidatus Omnitrophota bacterium]|jgi:dihydropteroate synthase